MATSQPAPMLPKWRSSVTDEYARVKEAVAKGLSEDEAAKTLLFPQYKDYRNYRVREHDIRSLYELIKTGKSKYLE